MICPRSDCAQELEVLDVRSGRFRVWEAVADATTVIHDPEGEIEVLEVWTLRCDAGHVFSGPAEALRDLLGEARGW